MEWEEKGSKFTLQTQLYHIGLYFVIYSGGRMVDQGTSDPKAMAIGQVKHIRQLISDGAKFSVGPVKAARDTGFLEEVNDEKP